MKESTITAIMAVALVLAAALSSAFAVEARTVRVEIIEPPRELPGELLRVPRALAATEPAMLSESGTRLQELLWRGKLYCLEGALVRTIEQHGDILEVQVVSGEPLGAVLFIDRTP